MPEDPVTRHLEARGRFPDSNHPLVGPKLFLCFGSWAKLRSPVIPVLERQRQKGQQLRITLIYIVSLGLTCATRDSTNKQTKNSTESELCWSTRPAKGKTLL